MPHMQASPIPAPPSRDAMRDALATLTRFSAELSHALDDGRKRSGRIVASPDLSGAHLPVFAREDSPSPTSLERRHMRPRRRSSRAHLIGGTNTDLCNPDSIDATAMTTASGSTCESGRSSRSEGRRRRRDMYRTAVRNASRSNAHSTCAPSSCVSGASVGTLFDVDDYLITHEDHVWAAPALADANRVRVKEEMRRKEEQPEEPRVSEGFFDNSSAFRSAHTSSVVNGVAPMKGVTFARKTETIEVNPVHSQRHRKPPVQPVDERVPQRREYARRTPIRAATVQPGRTSLGARGALSRGSGTRATAPAGAGQGVKVKKRKSEFVPGEQTQFVKQQSYCKTGHVPGLRRTRFLRLIGSQLVCYTRDLNKQLWMVDVQHSFVKISQAQRKVVVFCVGARRPLCFFLASNDMLASWSRALAKASVAAYPRKYMSQKTAKELQREGIVF